MNQISLLEQAARKELVTIYYGNLLTLKCILRIFYGRILISDQFDLALDWFAKRQRRFGKTSEQIEKNENA